MEKDDPNASPEDKHSPDATSREPSTENASPHGNLSLPNPCPAYVHFRCIQRELPVESSERLSSEKPQASQSPPPVSDYPDPESTSLCAGHYGVIIGAFCGLFASFGWRSGSGFFQSYYQENQLRDYSPSAISWINSVGFFLMYFGACFVGPITNRYGPQPLLLISCVLHVAGLLGASFSAKFYQFFLTQGVISSLGASGVFFISVQTMGRWFDTQQAFAIGISASGISAGGVIFPLMIQRLIPAIGFGWTMRSVVLVILVLVVVSNLCLRRPPDRIRRQRQLLMVAPEGESKWAGLSDWKLILTIVGTTLFANGYFVVLTFVVTVAGIRGWKDQIDALVVLNGSSFFGRIIPGLVADRAGKYNTMSVLGVLSTVLILALWVPHDGVPGSIVFSITFGFTSASTVSLGPSMLFQMSELRHMTRNLAILFFVQSFSGLTSSPIGGALLDVGKAKGSLYLQVFCGLMTGVGTALILLARFWLTKGVLWKKI